jgi:hypothetical protein
MMTRGGPWGALLVEVTPRAALLGPAAMLPAPAAAFDADTEADASADQVVRATASGELSRASVPACFTVVAPSGLPYVFPYSAPLDAWTHLAVVAASLPTPSLSLFANGELVATFDLAPAAPHSVRRALAHSDVVLPAGARSFVSVLSDHSFSAVALSPCAKRCPHDH